MSLTYRLVYTPANQNESSLENINFSCIDNNVHIRLRDYEDECVISGFVDKLTYLLTYLLNFEFRTNIVSYDDDDAVIDAFIERSNDVKYIKEVIKSKLNLNGIKLSKNYRKVKHTSFGSIKKDICPMLIENGIVQSCNLNTFLEILHLDLYDYLFNDAYEIVITKYVKHNKYKKFTDKELRKKSKNKEPISKTSIYNLW